MSVALLWFRRHGKMERLWLLIMFVFLLNDGMETGAHLAPAETFATFRSETRDTIRTLFPTS
jgi:hypothetical protein